MPAHQRALIALYSAIAVMSITGVLSKTIPLDAITITHMRCLIGGAALALFAMLGRSWVRLPDRRTYGGIVLLGILMAGHWSAFFKGMQVSTVAIGILAHYAHPVITVLLEPLLDRKRPAAGDLLAGLLVLTGMILMVPEWELNSATLMGVGFGLLSAICFASRNVFQRRWLQAESSSNVMLLQIAVVAVVTLPFAQFDESFAMPAQGWVLLLVLGLVVTAVCHTLIAMSLRSLSAKSVSLISCLQPPLAILLSWLLIGEIPDTMTVIGGALILATALYESTKSQAPSE